MGVDNNIEIPVKSNVDEMFTQWVINSNDGIIKSAEIGFYPKELEIRVEEDEWHEKKYITIYMNGSENYGTTIVAYATYVPQIKVLDVWKNFYNASKSSSGRIFLSEAFDWYVQKNDLNPEDVEFSAIDVAQGVLVRAHCKNKVEDLYIMCGGL